MKKAFLLCAALIFGFNAQAQVTLEYYLPDGIKYDSKIPTPKSVLGFEVGEWHELYVCSSRSIRQSIN